MTQKFIPETACVKNLAVRNVFVFPKSAGTNSPYDGYRPSPRLSGRFNRKFFSTEAVGLGHDYQMDRQKNSRLPPQDLSSETEVPKDDFSRDYQWKLSSTATEEVGDDYQINRQESSRFHPRDLSSETELEVPKNYPSREPATNYLDRDYQHDPSEIELPKNYLVKDYQSITYHPGAHQLPLSKGSPYSGYKQSRRLSQPRWPTAFCRKPGVCATYPS